MAIFYYNAGAGKLLGFLFGSELKEFSFSGGRRKAIMAMITIATGTIITSLSFRVRLWASPITSPSGAVASPSAEWFLLCPPLPLLRRRRAFFLFFFFA